MNPDRQKSLADCFRQLHHGPNILVLANCWDVASARVLEAEGVPAIATSSAGVAFSLGYPDGQRISRDEMLAVVARVAKAVKVPVTADVESGYGPHPQDAARTAQAVIEAGAVGMNLEDSRDESDTALADLSLAVEKIRAVREAGSKAGVPLVINARTAFISIRWARPNRATTTRCAGLSLSAMPARTAYSCLALRSRNSSPAL